MRITRALAVKAVLVSGIAGVVLSGSAMTLSVATAPAAMPAASAATSTPNMYYT